MRRNNYSNDNNGNNDNDNGDIDNDGTFDIITIDQDNNIKVLQNDI